MEVGFMRVDLMSKSNSTALSCHGCEIKSRRRHRNKTKLNMVMK